MAVSNGLQLDSDERVLWTGEPQRVALFERTDLLVVPPLLVFSIVVLLDELGAETHWPWHRRTEAQLRTLQPPVIREDATGDTGSIAFGRFPGVTEAMRAVGFAFSWPRPGPRPLVLHGIAQPRHVREVIAQAQR